jgi:general secretion pathway protein I
LNRSFLNRGFTLLEVLMAIAILGLGLSVLLGAQTGLFASATRTEHISLATGLARCRMSEVEVELLQKGFPYIDADGEGPCCMDQPADGYTCSWKVQRITLPEQDLGGDGGIDGGLASTEMSLGAGMDFSSSSAGPLGMLMQLQAGKNDPLGPKPDMSTLASSLTGSMGGVDGIASMAMSMVYPTLKPMLEASIRKAIVTVHWHEGSKERTLRVTQYITNPQQGLPDGGLMGDGGMLPGMPGMPGVPGMPGGTFGGLGAGLGSSNLLQGVTPGAR